MIFNVHWIYSVFATLLFAPPLGCYSFASHPNLGNLQQTQINTSFFKNNFGSTPSRKRRNRSDKTKVAFIGGTNIETSGDSAFGGLATAFLLIGLFAAVGTFVFANQVYTPEISQGAQMMRKSNRENEIRKLLEAVGSHQEDGNELLELRLPLETALGATLEEYITAVESSLQEKSDAIFTVADEDLVRILKQNV
uniref:Transmembrane protein n=1 Tax=Pseudo-nitzschia australis TaxID=44445 RepID=A0A7S4EJ29_9STRA|mmetsp:Transcript_9021/g.19475  ORF Transcript_9021/g.19475 Transcript_9021/m.19475 type:complete len:195 (+) Transcript_9021:236-820(+)